MVKRLIIYSPQSWDKKRQKLLPVGEETHYVPCCVASRSGLVSDILSTAPESLIMLICPRWTLCLYGSRAPSTPSTRMACQTQRAVIYQRHAKTQSWYRPLVVHQVQPQTDESTTNRDGTVQKAPGNSIQYAQKQSTASQAVNSEAIKSALKMHVQNLQQSRHQCFWRSSGLWGTQNANARYLVSTM